jgi:adenine-specific DNA methylase
MIKKTTITYDIEEYDDNTISKVIKYKKYNKVTDNEETVFTYKKIMKCNNLGEKYINNETFNKLNKNDNESDEIVGYSIDNNNWKIIELKNHVLNKEYEKKYDNIKLDITCDMFVEKHEDIKYINNK